VLSYERAAPGETLVVVVNLSSRSYAGIVASAAGDYREITPNPAARAATLPAVFLAPWAFRVFSRVSPANN